MGILSWIIALPFLTAFLVALAPRALVRWVALLGTGGHLLLTAGLTWRFLGLVSQSPPAAGKNTTLYLTERFQWFPSLGIQYFLGVDGISLSMVILTSLIIFTGVLASWHVEERAREFFAFLLVLVGGVFGVFLSFDLFLFFLFYEVAVLPMYLLIGIWGTGPKEYSAMKLTLMLMLGSALLLVGFLGLYQGAGLQSFDLLRLAEFRYPAAMQSWLFPVIFIGFGVLGALFPFHTWSPDGHASAPTAVSMLHAGVLMKLGGYGALRIAIFLLPEGAREWALFFLGLTTVNILYGAFGAIRQTDLKYFTAYSSVSHCGMVLFGLATLNFPGFQGAVLQMFSHGVMTGLFFSLIGMVYGRTHTRQIPEMGGLAKVMPWLAACFYAGGLASLGLPGFSGFVAELNVFMGGFVGNPWVSGSAMRLLTLLAAMSIVVTAVYVLRGLGRVFLGPITNEEFHQLGDARLNERLCTGILILTLLAVGIYPGLLTTLIEPALLPMLARLGN